MNNLKVSIAICIFGFFVFGSSLYSEADLKVNSSQDLKNSEKDEKVPPEAKQTDSDSSKELQVEGESEKKPSLTSKDIANLFPLKLGFFVDSYYNASFNRPNSKEASYTTQATRTNEFNINLAYLDANFETNKYRGRFAVQFGTSVAANYVGEGTTGKTSNEFSVRNMQEAYGGIKLGKSTWLDMGIYFGHLGYESWVSHDNFVYTRALSLDNVPYYVSGVRLSGKITDKLKYQLHLDNGYQVVTDNNKDVSGGFRLEWTPLKSLMFRWNTFIGNELPTAIPKEVRYYNNFIAEWKPSDTWIIASSFDVAYQRRADDRDLIYLPGGPAYINRDSSAYRQLYVGNLWVAYRFLPEWRIGSRLERYVDREQMIVQTGTAHGFQTGGTTTTLDYIPNETFLVRFTYQYRLSRDAVYPREAGMSRLDRQFIFSLSIKI
ncbi:outer membrane protein [Leptospira inadai serovar Lyme str. 10]|uniref:Outer membrane protein n=2 Tax=Leptospira inadai serovar Lyme TaxID=293084 RepID=V6H893_9LEPT|nr:outer membrane beta-barrel protein [Leptospira inadai]EQA35091.1 outer membrane protein [Leptospira inadai serovar Lyme str. 10]PNV75418.1 porin [Leptospira inadai serovar Lyme]